LNILNKNREIRVQWFVKVKENFLKGRVSNEKWIAETYSIESFGNCISE